RFSGPKTSIICSPMTSLKTSIKTITYLSDIGCLEIQGASLESSSTIESIQIRATTKNPCVSRFILDIEKIILCDEDP
ncbi:hypothetical protein, partial [Escherichia coli]|uniref:hypothetical protein n=1 Tax=Escherichia coli TaxID=562 RepID=UPI0034C5CA43